MKSNEKNVLKQYFKFGIINYKLGEIKPKLSLEAILFWAYFEKTWYSSVTETVRPGSDFVFSLY